MGAYQAVGIQEDNCRVPNLIVCRVLHNRTNDAKSGVQKLRVEETDLHNGIC